MAEEEAPRDDRMNRDGRDIWAELRADHDLHPLQFDATAEDFVRHWIPATEEQLRQTEAELGFSLPADLRRLYREVANGGLGLGWVQSIYGAAGGIPRLSAPWEPGLGERTIGQLVHRSGWRWHPRIDEALLRHPGCHVWATTPPEGFIEIGNAGCAVALEIDAVTGRVYVVEPGEISLGIDPDSGTERWCGRIWLVAPSLGDWFAQWLDGTWRDQLSSFALSPEQVETADLLDPAVVWRGIYYFGPY